MGPEPKCGTGLERGIREGLGFKKVEESIEDVKEVKSKHCQPKEQKFISLEDPRKTRYTWLGFGTLEGLF